MSNDYNGKKRSELPDSVFGIPQERKYPMPDEKHTRSAIKLFNHVDPKYEEQLAKAVIKNMKKYGIDGSVVGPNNRLRKYLPKDMIKESVTRPLIYTWERANIPEYSVIQESSHKSDFSYSGINTSTEKSEFKRNFREVFKEDPTESSVNYMQMIKYKGDLVGYIGFSRYKEGKKKYLGIGNFMILKRYQRSGMGSKVISDIIDRYKDNYDEIYCYVDKDNTNAIAFYKKIAKVNTDNLTKYGYYVTLYSKSIGESAMLEGYLKSDKDIYYNKDKFDSGEINLCFITGLIGSGKTTMSKEISSKNIERYEIDDVIFNYCLSDDDLKDKKLLYLFFNGIGKKYRYRYKDNEYNHNLYYSFENYEKDVTIDFVKYSIEYASSSINKIIIDGIWIYLYIEPKSLSDYAVYIKGTSMAKSSYRATNRGIQNKIDKGIDLTVADVAKKYIFRIKKDLKFGKMHMHKLKSFRSYFEKQSTNESYIEEGYFRSTDNLEFNLDKWSKLGPHNLLYITGISGSGKTTLAKEMCKRYKAEYIEFDKFTLGMVKGLDRWFENVNNGTYEVHPLLKEYFSQLDHLTTNGSWSKPDMGDEHTKFLIWLINKVKGDGTLYIVEGAQFFMKLSNMDPDLIKGEPLIVVGTSAFKSWVRRIKRDTANDETISRFIYHLKKDVPMLFKYYFSNERDLQKYIKNMQSNVNESYLLQESKLQKVMKDNIDESAPTQLENKDITIIFDLGDVLVKSNMMEDLKNKYKFSNSDIKTILSHWFDDSYDLYDSNTFIETMERVLPDKFKSRIFDIILAFKNISLYPYTEKILSDSKRLGYKIYYFSNWSRWGVELLEDANKLKFLHEYFNGGMFSYETKYKKPHKRFYDIFIQKFKLQKSNIIFFDNKQDNINMGKNFGWTGYVVDENLDQHFHDMISSYTNESSSILPQDTGISTVIFDIGDVLVSANIKDYLVADPEIPNEIVDELLKLWFIDKDETDDTMDLDTYREIVNKRMGVEFSKYIPKLFQYNIDCVTAFDYTIPMIQDLKDKGYKVYYLSNWSAWTYDLLQEAGKFDFLKLMDGGVFSYDAGYMKPNEEIYKILLNKYKINPEEAVFFDDREENIEAANKLGIHGIHFPRHDASIVYNNLYGRKLAKAIYEDMDNIRYDFDHSYNDKVLEDAHLSYMKEISLGVKVDEDKVAKEILSIIRPIIISQDNKSKASKMRLSLKCEIEEVDSGIVIILVLDGTQDKRDTNDARIMLKELASKCKPKLSNLVSKIDIGDGDEGCLYFTMDKGKIKKNRKDLIKESTNEEIAKSEINDIKEIISILNDDDFKNFKFTNIAYCDIRYRNGKPIAFITIRTKPVNNYIVGFVSLAVIPKYQNQGIGRSLTEKAIKWFKKNKGIDFLEWHCLPNNAASNKLANDAGFSRYIAKDDSEYNTYTMESVIETNISEYGTTGGTIVGANQPDSVYIVNYMQNNVFSGYKEPKQAICKKGMNQMYTTKNGKAIPVDIDKFKEEASDISVFRFKETPILSFDKIIENASVDGDFYMLLTGDYPTNQHEIEYDNRFVQEENFFDKLDDITYCTESTIIGQIEATDYPYMKILTESMEGRCWNYYRDINGVFAMNELTGLRTPSYEDITDIPNSQIQLIERGTVYFGD